MSLPMFFFDNLKSIYPVYYMCILYNYLFNFFFLL